MKVSDSIENGRNVYASEMYCKQDLLKLTYARKRIGFFIQTIPSLTESDTYHLAVFKLKRAGIARLKKRITTGSEVQDFFMIEEYPNEKNLMNWYAPIYEKTDMNEAEARTHHNKIFNFLLEHKSMQYFKEENESI